MNNNDCIKIYPKKEELSSICSRVKCPQENCNVFFQSTSNLNMHLIKHHKVKSDSLTRKTKTQYYCPTFSCPYFKDSEKYFTKLKYLKQHFLKVHALKQFACNKCDKKFSTEAFKAAHLRNCGKEFLCICGFRYKSSEALLTHCKRKGEGHYVCVDSKDKVETINLNCSDTQTIDAQCKKTGRLIYPKLSCDMSFPIHYIAAIALSELSAPHNLSKIVDKGMQTNSVDFNVNKGSKNDCNVIPKYEKKRKSSQHTQTISKLKKLKISAQTQTNCDYLKHKVKHSPKPVSRKRKKSMETQTKNQSKCISDSNFEILFKKNEENTLKEMSTKLIPDSREISLKKNQLDNLKMDCVTKEAEKCEFDNFDKDKEKKWLWNNQIFESDKNTPGISGNLIKNDFFDLSESLNLHNKELNLNDYSCMSEPNINSQFSSEQSPDNQIFDINKLCSIETQTDVDAIFTEYVEGGSFTLCSSTETQTTDDFDSLLYSNMYTQTCDDVDELFNFNFVHIETQTTWPDF